MTPLRTVLFLCLVAAAKAQIGDLCACQPSFYDFELDFSLSCDDVSFDSGPGTGIETPIVCFEFGRELNDDETNLEFAFVELIQVLELDQNNTPLQQKNLDGLFLDGYPFNYTSVLATSTNFDETTLPKAIQLNFFGNNTESRRIRATWSLFFSNNCNVFPVVEPFETAVATVVTDVADPPRELCPLVTDAPSPAPTFLPTEEPTLSPTVGPQVGVDLCGCQPGHWDFTFAFELTCDDNTFGPPEVVESECISVGVPPLDSDIPASSITDLQFVVVDLVVILELNRNNEIVNQDVQTGPFEDDDTISFVSILATAPSLNADTIPVGIQTTLEGRNELNETVRVTWSLRFDQSCTIFPLVTDADSIGPTNITGVSDPQQQFCPLVTLVPTFSPTQAPTDVTPAPTQKPTQGAATQAPTPKPTMKPTMKPVPVPPSPKHCPPSPPWGKGGKGGKKESNKSKDSKKYDGDDRGKKEGKKDSTESGKKDNIKYTSKKKHGNYRDTPEDDRKLRYEVPAPDKRQQGTGDGYHLRRVYETSDSSYEKGSVKKEKADSKKLSKKDSSPTRCPGSSKGKGKKQPSPSKGKGHSGDDYYIRRWN